MCKKDGLVHFLSFRRYNIRKTASMKSCVLPPSVLYNAVK